MSKELYWQRPSTKTELSNNLYNLESILNPKVVKYLNSLLELEFSVLKKEINNRDRKLLSEFLIYRKIAMYNIYNRALKIINDSGIDYKILNCGRHSTSLKTAYQNKDVNLYLFNFDCNYHTPSDSFIGNLIRKEPGEIGTINLFQYYDDMDELEIQRNNLIHKITGINKQLYNRDDLNYLNYKGTDDYNKRYFQSELATLEERMRNGLSKEAQEAIKIINYVHDLLLEDFGLKINNFSENKIGTTCKVSTYNSPKLLVKNIKKYI